MSKNIEKRSKLFINPKFQIRFILYFISAVLVSMVILYLSELYFFKQMFIEGIELNLPADHTYYKLLVKQENFMTKIFIVTAGVVSIILMVFGLIISHRIAGPFNKLTNYFVKIGKGDDVRELSFRKNDFFQEIPKAFNEMLIALEEKHKRNNRFYDDKDKQ